MNRRTLLSGLLVSCALIGTACAPAAEAVTPVGLAATITRVVDGDTVHATDARGSAVKVRVLGIDTPETRDPRKPVGCFGPEASEFAKKTLLNQRVTLVTDPTQGVVDRYKRVLAYIRLADGRDYSIEAARAGMARSYVYDRKPVAEYVAIEAAQAEAKAARRGLWGCLS